MRKTKKTASRCSLMALACGLAAVCPAIQAQVTGSGSANYIPIFTNSSNVGDSAIYQTGSGDIGIGTTTPAATLEVNGSAKVEGSLTLSGDILWSGGGPLMQFSTNGQENFSAGVHAGLSNHASQNTAVGYEALKVATTGSQNTAVGNLALVADTTGFLNTAIGFNAMLANTTGPGNTAVGQQTLLKLTTGEGNLALGQYAGNNLTVESNDIDLANDGVAGDSGVIRIGTPAYHTSAYISGIATSNVSGVPVLVTSGGQLGIATSSRRYKEDIHDMADASAGLLSLRPVTFRYKQPYADGSKPIQYGLIAEEVAEVYPDLVVRSADGQIQTVKYQVLDAMLLNELQKQSKTISALEDRLTKMEAALAGNAVSAWAQK